MQDESVPFPAACAEEDPPLAGSRDFPPSVPQYAGPVAGLIPDAKGRGRTPDQPRERFSALPRFDLTLSSLRIPLAFKFFKVN